jgi:hypothetical protein
MLIFMTGLEPCLTASASSMPASHTSISGCHHMVWTNCSGVLFAYLMHASFTIDRCSCISLACAPPRTKVTSFSSKDMNMVLTWSLAHFAP